MLEPIQGENGIRMADDNYLPDLRQLCDRHKLLLILDEVQTGVARTGAWYCFQHSNIMPDILSSAKALGNGFPIGACLAKANVAKALGAGTHGSTFGGNPIACAVALTVLRIISEQSLCQQAAKIGAYIQDQFRHRLKDINAVTEVRGQGLMIGIELKVHCKDLVEQAMQQFVLINVTKEKVIRLLPPLIVTQQEADMLVDKITVLIRDFCDKQNA